MHINDLDIINGLNRELCTAKELRVKARDNTGTEGVRVWIDGKPQTEEVVAQVRDQVVTYWSETIKRIEHDLKQLGVEL